MDQDHSFSEKPSDFPAGDTSVSAMAPESSRSDPGSEKMHWLARLSTTHVNARAGLVSDTLVSVALLIAAALRHDVGAAMAIMALLSGVLLFSFVEYGMHRWLFHGRLEIAERGHDKHHQDPLGHDALPFFLPPLGMLLLAAALAWCMPVTCAFLVSGGVAAGYAAYGLSHSAIHIFRFRMPLIRRWAAAHHVHHHHPGSNFGVTSPLWDILLGTRYVSPSASAGHAQTNRSQG